MLKRLLILFVLFALPADARFVVNQLSGFGAGGVSAVLYEEGGGPYTPLSGGNPYGYTVYDRSWAIDNGATITHFSVYAQASNTIFIKIALENSSTDLDNVVNQSVSHSGGGWQEFTLTTPYVIPGSGTYRAGVFVADAYTVSNESVARSVFLGNSTGSGDTFTADSSQVWITKVRGTI